MMDFARESLAGRVALLHMSALSQHEIYGSGENVPFIIKLEALKQRKKLVKVLHYWKCTTESDVHGAKHYILKTFQCFLK
jgi:hypothetical protein